MVVTDPIADMLTRIRNANTAKHDTVDVPSSKIKLAIAQILLDEGYIKSYDLVDNGNFKDIHITLKYGKDKNVKIITGLKRISKPGLRVYANEEDLPKVIPDRSTNFAIIGQFVEIPEDIVFTEEYSVRSARTAIYNLFNVKNKKICKVTEYKKKAKVIKNALKALYR